MKIYLDNCCFNRPFDEQSHIRIRLESEAKLNIQEAIRAGRYNLVWSYMLDYENNKNPFNERKEQIRKWKYYAKEWVEDDTGIMEIALTIHQKGIGKLDSLHIACAISTKCDFFITTDDKVLKKGILIENIKITDPISFVRYI